MKTCYNNKTPKKHTYFGILLGTQNYHSDHILYCLILRTQINLSEWGKLVLIPFPRVLCKYFCQNLTLTQRSHNLKYEVLATIIQIMKTKLK